MKQITASQYGESCEIATKTPATNTNTRSISPRFKVVQVAQDLDLIIKYGFSKVVHYAPFPHAAFARCSGVINYDDNKALVSKPLRRVVGRTRSNNALSMRTSVWVKQHGKFCGEPIAWQKYCNRYTARSNRHDAHIRLYQCCLR